jgi:hypothetical protein
MTVGVVVVHASLLLVRVSKTKALSRGVEHSTQGPD